MSAIRVTITLQLQRRMNSYPAPDERGKKWLEKAARYPDDYALSGYLLQTPLQVRLSSRLRGCLPMFRTGVDARAIRAAIDWALGDWAMVHRIRQTVMSDFVLAAQDVHVSVRDDNEDIVLCRPPLRKNQRSQLMSLFPELGPAVEACIKFAAGEGFFDDWLRSRKSGGTVVLDDSGAAELAAAAGGESLDHEALVGRVFEQELRRIERARPYSDPRRHLTVRVFLPNTAAHTLRQEAASVTQYVSEVCNQLVARKAPLEPPFLRPAIEARPVWIELPSWINDAIEETGMSFQVALELAANQLDAALPKATTEGEIISRRVMASGRCAHLLQISNGSRDAVVATLAEMIKSGTLSDYTTLLVKLSPEMANSAGTLARNLGTSRSILLGGEATAHLAFSPEPILNQTCAMRVRSAGRVSGIKTSKSTTDLSF
jgi:hypothetical protein